MTSGSMTARRILTLTGVLGVLALGCAPDESDVYTVDAPPATRAPLPATTPAPVMDDAASSVDEAGIVETASADPETFPANGVTVEVRSLDNSFRPETLEIEAGTEVLWINGGRNEHNVLPVDEVAELTTFRADTADFAPGDEYAYVFDTPGVFPYYCSIHGTQEVGMVGTIVVTVPA
jgi:plastocyanin